jgi:hypothetical protein
MTSSAHGKPQGIDALATLPVTPLAILLSCFFSALVILQNPLLNNDAYSSYLPSMDVFNESGGLAVLQSFGWFNYSILVALLDRLLPGGPIAASHLFNALCYTVLTWAFLLFSRELRATPRTQLFAALCIILGLPLLNEMRYFLIRDIAFCAFAMLSLTGLARFLAHGTARYAFWWCGALLLATAFRLETLLLLALAPLAVLMPDGARSLRVRGRRFALLVGIELLMLALLVALGSFSGVDFADLIAYAYRWYLPLLASLPMELVGGTTAEVLTARPELTLLGGLTAFLDNVVNAFSVPLTVLVLLFGLSRRSLPAAPVPARRALQFYTGISLITLATFVAIMHFLTQRYALLLCLLLLSLVPLILDDLYAAARQRGTLKRFHAIFGFYCFYYLVDSLVSFGYSQQHIVDGLAWTRSELPAGASLKTNNFAVAYHSGRVTDYDKTVRDASVVVQDSATGDYLVLDIGHDDDTEALDTNSQLTPLERFANERGDEVRIYLRR